jgi:hypothetical protein
VAMHQDDATLIGALGQRPLGLSIGHYTVG